MVTTIYNTSYWPWLQHNPCIWKTQFPVDTEAVWVTKIQWNKYYNKKFIKCCGNAGWERQMFLLRMGKDSENLHNKDILSLGLQGQAGSCINKRAEGHQSKVYSDWKGMRRWERPWVLRQLGVSKVTRRESIFKE